MRGVIFDVDGTLWDSTEKVLRSWHKACEEHHVSGERITSERLKKEFGKTLEDIGQSLFPELPLDTAVSIAFRACELENVMLPEDPPAVYDGVPELFRALTERGHSIYIVSNCLQGYIETLLGTSGLSPLVTDHLCAGDTGVGKSETMRILIEKNHVPAPVYVGDTMGDYNSTKALGLPFIFAAYGFGEVASPDAVIHSPLELLEVLETM